MKYRIVALICALSMSLSLVTPAMAAETPYDNVTDIVVSEVVEDENGKELKAAAETPVVAEGECGDNLMWSLDEKRVLSISGTGKMYDYFSSNAPWYEYRSEIKKIELNVGITKIGAYAFSGCMATGDLIIPNGVTEIGEFAFRSCSGFTGKLVLPNTLTKIYGNAFDGCRNLCGILELPDNVTEIRDAAFSDCRGITGVVFPSELTKITAAMFNGCSGLS